MENIYAFLYSKEEKETKNHVLVKCLVTGESLAIDLQDLEAQDKDPYNILINVKDFFSEEQPKNYGDMYKNFAVLIENVNSKLLRKLDAKDAAKNPDTTSKKTDAESSLSLHRLFPEFEEHDCARTGRTATEMVELKDGPQEQFTHEMEPFLRDKGVVELVADHACEEVKPLSPEAAQMGLFANVKKPFLMQILHLGIRKGLTKEVLQNMAHLKINLEDLSQTELLTLCVANGVNCKKNKKEEMLASLRDHKRSLAQKAEVRGKDMEDEIPPLRDKLSEMEKC
ncbi:hypothetical protein PVAP13_9NG001625 [Panicum virgatum]|uniref:Uncharacterized protein n=1 Tax=Panicum virgatum TaxID=38727 RepID=A0A8T0MC56_PANVG|nr:hypothetical protein PVAP13_9NG001625 [Panicum virgatum]